MKRENYLTVMDGVRFGIGLILAQVLFTLFVAAVAVIAVVLAMAAGLASPEMLEGLR
jgi:hypothetical protein